MARERVTALRTGAAALGVLAIAVLGLGHPAAAQADAPTADELGLEVSVGHGDRQSSGSWTPVEVAVAPTRLLAADLAVSSRSRSGMTTEVRTIEATAGTRRVYRFLVPSGAVSVRVDEEGREALEVRARAGEADRGFVLGVLGAVPDGAPALRDEPTGLQGHWVAVDAAWLAVSPDSLEGLSGLVVRRSALDELSEQARVGLSTAAAAGLEVLLVADVPGPVEGLGIPLPVTDVHTAPSGVQLSPAEGAWVTTAGDLGLDDGDGEAAVAARVPVGHGGLVVVGAGPGEPGLGGEGAFWSGLAGPRHGMGVEPGDWAVAELPYQFARLFSTTESGAPSLPWLAAFTAAYVLVVGPVNGLLLARMRRRELAWVTVPIVTVVFTAGAFLGIAGGRPTEAPAGRLLVTVDGASTEHVVAGVRAATGGDRSVEIAGEGWTTRALGSADAELRGGSDVLARLELAALEHGGVHASRPVPAAGPLSITATAGPDGVHAVVRNTGGADLEGVVVRAATSSSTVGALAAGEEREVAIERTELSTASPYRDPFEGLPTGAPRSFEALLRDRVVDGNPGIVWAVGTLAAGDPGVSVDGDRPDDRGLLLAVGTTPASEGALSPFAVQREVLTTQRRVFRPSPQALEGPDQAFLRFRLPGDVAVEHLRARLGRETDGVGRQISVWEPAGRTWQPVADAFPEGTGDAARLVDAFGRVHIRVEGELHPFEFSGLSVDGLGGS